MDTNLSVSKELQQGGPAPSSPAGSPAVKAVSPQVIEEVAEAVAEVATTNPLQQRKLKRLLVLVAMLLIPVAGWVTTKATTYFTAVREDLDAHIQQVGHPGSEAILKAVLDGQKEDREVNREWRNQMHQDMRELRADVKDLLRSSARGVADRGVSK